MRKLVEIIEYKRKDSHSDLSILLSIQNLEYQLHLQFNKIATLETSKREAVTIENYDHAKQCKEDIDELRTSLLAMVCIYIYISMMVILLLLFIVFE